jgi:hypothetical protein
VALEVLSPAQPHWPLQRTGSGDTQTSYMAILLSRSSCQIWEGSKRQKVQGEGTSGEHVPPYGRPNRGASACNRISRRRVSCRMCKPGGESPQHTWEARACTSSIFDAVAAGGRRQAVTEGPARSHTDAEGCVGSDALPMVQQRPALAGEATSVVQPITPRRVHDEWQLEQMPVVSR